MVTKPTSRTALGKIEKSNNSISQFFQRNPKPTVDNGLNCLRAEENSGDVIVLDDDSEDDLDSNNIGIVDLTNRSEPNISHVQGSQAVRDEDQQNAGAQKTSISSKCDADVVHDTMTNTKDTKQLHNTDREKNSTIEKDLAVSLERPPTSLEKKENPFAKFAHGSSVGLESRVASAVRTTWRQHSSSTRPNKRPNSCASNDGDDQNDPRSKKIHTGARDKKKKEKEFVKMKDHPPQEQMRIVRKWHSMADPLASVEHRRYQVLLAARLHARCQEPTTRKAMQKLREHFVSLSEDKTITVEDMAKSDPEELTSHISSLQFYNVKAKQIVKAAQEIKSRHGGVVPEDEFSLLQITSIGKTYADLLAFVNTRERHEQLCSQAVPV